MKNSRLIINQFQILKYILNWSVRLLPLGIVVGSFVALFLWLLEKVTEYRITHPIILFFLPLAGILIVILYKLWGKASEKGNDLIIEEIHKPGGGVPASMAPLVVFATLLTHLFGGSAGREGTAVQIGGSIAGLFGRLFKLNEQDIKIVLSAGIAGGFGAVFSTPLAGTVFALEVLAIGSIKYDALLPCLISSVVANYCCLAWGIHHTIYVLHGVNYSIMNNQPIMSMVLMFIKVIIAGIAFGLTGNLFAEVVHQVNYLSKRLIKIYWLRPVVGGIIILLLAAFIGADYLGLGDISPRPGMVSIVSSFSSGGSHIFSWFWKLIFTALTLGTGFKGGEVTPLFYIGSTLGNSLAVILHAPISLFAALGFIGVFAGASNTPLACTIMGIELFGSEYTLYFAVTCFTSYYLSGHSGIYSSQRIIVPKLDGATFSPDMTITNARSLRNSFMKRRIQLLKRKLRRPRN